MTHTTPTTIAVFVITGGVLTWALQGILTALGQPAVVPPWSWGVVLALLGGLLLGIAWPIRARLRQTSTHHLLDPFYATRVVLLAKSSTIAGAFFVGAAMGAAVFFVSRPVVMVEALWASGLALVGSIVLVVAGAVVEGWCTLPPESRDRLGDQAPEGEA